MIGFTSNDVAMGVSESSLPKDLFLLQDRSKLQQLHHNASAPVKKPKNVRFHPSVTVRPTIARADITAEEKAQCWYSKNEYDVIRHKCAALVEYSSQSKTNVKFCVRGLEAHIGNTGVEKYALRHMVAYAIADIQDSLGSAKEIATVCLPVSEESAKRAVAMAERDYREAQRCLRTGWR